MSITVQEFLKQIEHQDSKNYFLFNKFYLFPNLFLGGNGEETLKNYYDYGEIKKVMFNPKFLEFLYLCLNDTKFIKKLDYNLLKKIKFILLDTQEFKKNYMIALEDENLKKICRSKNPTSKKYINQYGKLQYWKIVNHYQKFEWLYETNISSQQRNSIDDNLLDKLIQLNSQHLKSYYERYIRPQEKRRNIIERIKTDDYHDLTTCFLANRNGHDNQSFTTIVCNNEFLEIARTILLPKTLPNIVMDNIIEILTISINFKMMNAQYNNFYQYYQKLGEEQIKKFDYQEALDLITLFTKKKKNGKIISLHK